MEEIDLQPLRITSGWEIEWNQFYEVDPSEDMMTYFGSSSLLHVNKKHARRAINLDWSPENDVNGYYYLRVLNLTEVINPRTKEISYDGDWDNLHYEFTSNNRLEVVKELERLFLQVSTFKG